MAGEISSSSALKGWDEGTIACANFAVDLEELCILWVFLLELKRWLCVCAVGKGKLRHFGI